MSARRHMEQEGSGSQTAPMLHVIELTEKKTKPEHPITINVLATEYADLDQNTGRRKGCKIVFHGMNEKGKPATFEAGSFLDNGHDPNIPDKHDVCVSTAGGCTRKCNFCAVPTAELGFERLLSAEEIEFQIRHIIELRNPDGNLPNVIGMMGNGEPPDNARNVIAALKNVIDDPAVDIDRVTLSTIGENQKGIRAFTEAFADSPVPVKMQFSLHVADDIKRREIIPGKRSIEDIMADMDAYTEATGIPVKYNVVLMKSYDGFTNTSPEDAQNLARLLLSPSANTGEPIERRLKLSAYNPIPGRPFYGPSEKEKTEFIKILIDEGINTIKTFKGSGIDIDGVNGKGGFACGQLRATTNTR